MSIVKTTLFYTLMTCRHLVLMLCGLLALLCLTVFVGSFFMPDYPRWLALGLCILLVALSWFYDHLILKLTPEDKAVVLAR
ncbi:hypothetical protein SAMN05519104_7755 [Rhizobiales bacterium GAS188]|nr:hypothetical protein SAMN05519104_7755 [Rhizobiales bacterium GAS188]